MEIHVCQNCGNEYSEHFCNRCGQKTVHRISISHVVHEVLHSFTHADKGIIFLFLELFKRPGIVAREFIVEGKRKKYFPPLQYLLIVASIATFVVLSTHLMEHVMDSNPFKPTGGFSTRETVVSRELSGFLSKYFNLVLLLQLPLFSLGSYIVYKKYKLHYAEHLTLHMFITGQVTIITTVMMLLFVYTKPVLFYILPTIGSFIYTVIAYRQFFNERSWKGSLKATFSYLLSHFIYVLLFSIVVGVMMFVIMKFKLHAA